MTAMHEDSMKKYIKAVGIRIITDVKGYGVAVAAVLLYEWVSLSWMRCQQGDALLYDR